MVIDMIWNCRAASDVWTSSRLSVQKWLSMPPDMNQLWSILLDRLSLEDTVVATFIMRNI